MAHLDLQSGTYRAAESLLNGRSSRRIGHNTTLHTSAYGGPGSLAVRYHSTDVYTMTPDGWAIIRTGGWYTSTTSQRVNALLPGRWYVSFNRGLYFGGHLITPYTDGLAVNVETGAVGFAGPNGTPGVLLTAADVAVIVAASEERAEVRAVKRAARILAEHPTARTITYRADIPHSRNGYQSPMPNPHRMDQWRAMGECERCAEEAAAYKVIRLAALAEDHPNGHAWSVDVNGATISEPAGTCPHDCPDRPRNAYGW